VIVVDPRSVTRDEIVAVRSALDQASARLIGAVIVERRGTTRLGDRSDHAAPSSTPHHAVQEVADEPTPTVPAR